MEQQSDSSALSPTEKAKSFADSGQKAERAEQHQAAYEYYSSFRQLGVRFV